MEEDYEKLNLDVEGTSYHEQNTCVSPILLNCEQQQLTNDVGTSGTSSCGRLSASTSGKIEVYRPLLHV